MLKTIKTYGILCTMFAGSFLACTPKKYDYTNNVVPATGISYSQYNYGTGTSATTGAWIINVHSNSINTYNEYYIVQIFGIGTYTIQPGYNQLFIPDVWANTYNFSVEKVCTAGNTSGCVSRTLTGLAMINTEATTVAEVWL